MLWSYARHEFFGHPVTGIGFGDLPYAIRDNLSSGSLTSHAHSIYLSIAAEGGLLGLSAFATLLAAFLRDVHVVFGRYRLLAAGILGAGASLLVSGLTDTTMLKDPCVMNMTGIVVGLGLGLAGRGYHRHDDDSVVVLPLESVMVRA